MSSSSLDSSSQSRSSLQLRAISLKKPSRHFPSERGVITAVDNVSMRTFAGEVYGLLGPNGAGKTTTLRMLLELLPPTFGEVEIMGTRVSDDRLRSRSLVGLVPASAGVPIPRRSRDSCRTALQPCVPKKTQPLSPRRSECSIVRPKYQQGQSDSAS